jgi:hypothetical protein
MKEPKPSTRQARARQRQRQTDEFYEVMPLTASPHYIYRDDVAMADDTPEDNRLRDQTRVTAIITLLLVSLAAVIMGLLFVRGLQTMQDALPAGATTNTYMR